MIGGFLFILYWQSVMLRVSKSTLHQYNFPKQLTLIDCNIYFILYIINLCNIYFMLYIINFMLPYLLLSKPNF